MPHINLTITGDTAEELLNGMRKLAGNAEGGTLDSLSDEELLKAVRERMANHKPPMVVRVVPFESTTSTEENGSDDTGGQPKRRSRRSSKTETAKTESPVEETPPADESTDDGQENSTTEPADEPQDASEPQEGDDEVTYEDAKKAIDVYATEHGIPATQAKIRELFNVAKIKDLPTERMGEVKRKFEALLA